MNARAKKLEAWSHVWLGLSLTGITATVLFFLVAVNPKEPVYGSAPWAYAAASACFAVVFNRVAVRAAEASERAQGAA